MIILEHKETLQKARAITYDYPGRKSFLVSHPDGKDIGWVDDWTGAMEWRRHKEMDPIEETPDIPRYVKCGSTLVPEEEYRRITGL